MIVVEDIHWADEATLDLLRYLSLWGLRDAAVLLIATYRDDGLAAGDPLRVTLGDLGSHRCTRRAGLVPLSPGGGAGAALAEWAARSRAVRADRREPVLRDGSAAGRHGRGTPGDGVAVLRYAAAAARRAARLASHRKPRRSTSARCGSPAARIR